METPYAASVWGPHYWAFLHAVAHTFPEFPNDTTKRKYYDLFSNLPLFIPNAEMGARFAKLLDAFPVSPYLGSRDSLVQWTFLVHNHYNALLAKPEIDFSSAETLLREKYQLEILRSNHCARSKMENLAPDLLSAKTVFGFDASVVFSALALVVLFCLMASYRPELTWSWPATATDATYHPVSGPELLDSVKHAIADARAAVANVVEYLANKLDELKR